MTYRSDDIRRKATVPEVLKLGLEHQRAGRFDKAEAIYRKVLGRRPKNPHALHLLGVVAHQVGKNDTAVELIGKAIARNPNIPDYHSNLGVALKDLERFEEAERAHREALRLQPEYPEAYNNLGVALREQDRLEEAENAYREALRLDPEFAEAHNNLGLILKRMGRSDAAEESHREALRLKPDFAEANYNVAMIHTYDSLNHADFARIRALLDRPGVPRDDRIQFNFALGKMYDECGSFEQAFAHFQEGNLSKRQTTQFDASAQAAGVDRTMATFSEEFLARRESFGSPSELPVFIVGVSRSGKTLTECIIAGHPQAHGAGELLTLPKDIIQDELLTRLGATKGYLECVGSMDSATALALAELYEDRLRRDAGGDIRRICDTLPTNLFHLGFISLLFPKAKVIHCRRDPLDTCLAIYAKLFAKGNRYSYDLSTVGSYYRQYQRLMAHWRDVSPLSMLEIDYEDLVSDPEGTARRLIDFIGLEWDERCLAFHRNPLPGHTANPRWRSSPFQTRWVGHWRNYEPFLGPLKDSLGIG